MKRQIETACVLLLVALVAMAGCKKPAEQSSMDADNQEQIMVEQSIEAQQGEQTHDHEHGAHQEGGHHHHRFDEPEKYATRWNDPERDSWQHPEEIIAALNLSPGAVVADIGAGTGYLVAHLSRAVGEGGEVVAIDVEESMIQYLAKKKADLGPAKITPRKVSSESPALGKETVDGVVTLNTWHHISGRDAYAKKVLAGLKPGGRFVVVDFLVDESIEGPPMKMRLEAETIVGELQGAGFSRVEVIEESMPRHYVVVGTK